MNAAEITALATGIPAILAAITALINSLRAKATANAAAHVATAAHNAVMFPASGEVKAVIPGTVEPPTSPPAA